jgi:putative nucleotidyltransferase with HDIG domain
MARAPKTQPLPNSAAAGALSGQLVADLLATLRTGSDIHLHSRRVADLSAAVAEWLGASPRGVARLRLAGLLHDVGKIHTPAAILDKRGPLTEAEYAVVKLHSEHGAAMVAPLGDQELTAIVRHHHERYDGRGYPAGLSGREIPLGARIVAVADTFDAVTSSRPYRPAIGEEEALDLLDAEAGSQLDPEVVVAFEHCHAAQRGRRARQVLVTPRGPSAVRPILWAPG